jgi:hypothetical protein
LCYPEIGPRRDIHKTRRPEEDNNIMGAFLFGLIVGIAITLAIVVYDEGEFFLKLHHGIKRSMERYKAAPPSPPPPA